MAGRTLFVTLTVGGDRLYGAGVTDNVRAREFHKEDVQAYIDRVRKYIRPGRMRMFWVGENGDAKGRVHYHLLLYLYGTDGPADLVLDTRYFHGKMAPGIVEMYPTMPHVDGKFTYWPWGYSFYREFQERHSYYLASYVTKVFRDESGQAERVFYTRPGVSTKPLLGALWFRWFARQHVEQRISPQSRTYSFAREAGYKGGIAEYWMGDATFRLFVGEFVQGWRLAYGKEPWPNSAVLDEHLEMVENREAASRPYEWDDFFVRHSKIVREKADIRARRASMARAGIVPAGILDGVDDALNAALAGMPEAEWRSRFGSFEEHEKRWQLEARLKAGRSGNG